MNADLTSLLAAGLPAILIATAALILLVRRDLAPAGLRLGAGGRFLLGGALGLGVIAFTVKVLIIVTLANFPQQTIAPLIAEVGQRQPGASGLDTNPRPDPLPYEWKALPAVPPTPADNPVTPAKVALGKRLFHDPLLSRDRTISCASCHDIAGAAGTDGRATALGIDSQVGARNAPTVWNAAFQARLFWDGRAGSLEEQAMGPPVNPAEMGMPDFAAIEARVAAAPSYRAEFAQAFGPGTPITMLRIAQAIASFERTLVAADTPYDRFIGGDVGALAPAQLRGMWLFQSAGCIMCHSGANFSGASRIGPRNPFAPLHAHRSAIAARHDLTSDKGAAAPGTQTGIWRIPSLRNVALTAPYFHNGSVTDLREAVLVMATAQLGAVIGDDPQLRRNPQWSPERRQFDTRDRLVLSNRDIDDLVAFLHALSSDTLLAGKRLAEGKR